MHLYLSNDNAWRTHYSSEDGLVLYKVDAPRVCWGKENITIEKLQSSNHYVQLAEIEFHSTDLSSNSSKISIGGSKMLAKDVFRKGKFRWSSYGEKVFQGPDGHEYVWNTRNTTSELTRKDTGEMVATSHRKRHGILSKARPGSLEIFPAGEHMVDDIVTGFVYVERLRADTNTTAAVVASV